MGLLLMFQYQPSQTHSRRKKLILLPFLSLVTVFIIHYILINRLLHFPNSTESSGHSKSYIVCCEIIDFLTFARHSEVCDHFQVTLQDIYLHKKGIWLHWDTCPAAVIFHSFSAAHLPPCWDKGDVIQSHLWFWMQTIKQALMQSN